MNDRVVNAAAMLIACIGMTIAALGAFGVDPSLTAHHHNAETSVIECQQ